MNNDERILDYINGILPNEYEGTFFNDLASNDIMKNDLRYYLSLKSAIQTNISNVEPPIHLRDNIYKTASASVFPKQKGKISKDKKRNISYFSLGVIFTGLILSLVYFFGLRQGDDNNFQSQYANVEQSKPNVSNSKNEFSNYKLSTVKNYDKSRIQMTIKNDDESSSQSNVQFSNDKNNLITDSDLITSIALNFSQFQTMKVNLNNNSNSSLFENTLANESKNISNFSFINFPLNLMIGISGSQSLFFPSNPASNNNPKFLNNGSLSVYYKFSKYLSIGAELRKETFVQRIYLPDTINIPNRNEKNIAEVQKDFLTPALSLMISSPLVKL